MRFLPFIGRRYWKSLPPYLVDNYWWAYLWKPAIWFFDHQPIIDLIVFRHYRQLVHRTLENVSLHSGRFLQLTCVYGELSRQLLHKCNGATFYAVDVAEPQLKLLKRKLNGKARLARMNTEKLAFCNACFDAVLIFFLFHEQPRTARESTLREALRVLKPNGSMYITEYANNPRHHFLSRFRPARFTIAHLEPFLAYFWQWPVHNMVETNAADSGKIIAKYQSTHIFNKFYQVNAFHFQPISEDT